MPHIHIREAFSLYMEQFAASQIPSFVYHYTSASVFRSVLKDEMIFATRADFLDDELEYAVAQQRYEEVLDDLVAEDASPLSDAASMAAQRLVIDSIRGATTWRYFGARDPYVACFSGAPDMLSQWRAYADDGRGYAIGLPPETLAPVTGSYEGDAFMAPCLYDSEKQRSLLSTVLGRLLPEAIVWADSHGQMDPQFYGDEGDDLVFLLAHYACLFKDYSYAEEKEWRLVLPQWARELPAHDVPESRGVLRPVRHVSLPCDAPIEIWIGPRAPKEAEEATAILLEHCGWAMERYELYRSQIPLRY